MSRYKIIVTQSIDRVYEVEAGSKKEAMDIYFNYDSRTKFIEEKELEEVDTQIEVKRIKPKRKKKQYKETNLNDFVPDSRIIYK